LNVKAALDSETMAVFDNMPLEQVAERISSQLGVSVYVDSVIAKSLVNIVSERTTYRELLEKITASTQVFLVYRDGFILFTPAAEFNMVASSTLQDSPTLIKFSKTLVDPESVLRVEDNQLRAILTRHDLLKMRSLALNSGLKLEIVTTDLVIGKFGKL